MKSAEQIAEIFNRYGGIMRRSELTHEGVSACTLRRLAQEGAILRPRTGYYEWVDGQVNSEVALIRKIFPEAIVCMHSALYVYGYTDRVPAKWHLAAPLNATRSKYRQDYPPVAAYFLTPESLALGVTETKYDGVPLRLYDRDRTICDCIAHRNRMDPEIFNKAVRAYCEDPERNISRLMEYAHRLRREQPVTQIISLWQ